MKNKAGNFDLKKRSPARRGESHRGAVVASWRRMAPVWFAQQLAGCGARRAESGVRGPGGQRGGTGPSGALNGPRVTQGKLFLLSDSRFPNLGTVLCFPRLAWS